MGVDIITLLLRTVFIYFFLLIILRVMGKREIGQLSLLDFIVSIMIAELAVVSLESIETPLFYAILPIVVLTLIQIIFAYISLKSRKLRNFFDGTPSVLVKKGKVDEEEMRKQRYNFDDLLTQLREKQITNIADVEFAILESSGKLSVIPKAEDQQAELPLPLILDGEIQHENIQKLNKTELWLRQQLRNLGFRNLKQISYCVQYEDESFFIDLKDER